MAIWVQRTAIGWLTWQLSESGTWLGIMSLAYLLPLVIVGPIGGAFADRRDQMRIIMACQVIMGAAALMLAGLAIGGGLTLWVLLAITLVQGTTEAMSQPAQLALVPSLVPKEDLSAAIATTSVTFNSSRFLGPAISGGIIAAAGPGLAFTVAAIGFATFLALLVAIHPRVKRVERPRREGFAKALAAGIRYTCAHSVIGPLMLLVIVLGGCGRSVVELFPAFAEVVFDAGPTGLAALASSVGIGAVLAGLRWSGAGKDVNLRRALLTTSALAAPALCLFLLAPTLWVALPVLVCLGFCTASSGITVQTMINLVVEDDLRGRVLSLYGVCFRGSPAIGALAIGVAADFAGLKWPVLAAAAVLMVSWLALRSRIAAR